MEQGLALLFPVFLGLLQRGQGGPLELEPPDPVVAVSLGGSQQLTCRLACADHRTPSVQWRGLDTSLGAVRSDAGSSVLYVRNASLSAAGTRVCVGSCGTLTFQRTVQLLVFAFPDQLTVSPVALVAKQDREVACTAHNITPASPEALSLSLLLGDQELEGVQALGWDVEEEPQRGEDQLLRVTERWLLPPLETPTPLTLHCRATMKLPGQNLTQQRAIPVLHRLTSPEPPVTTSAEATPELSSTHSSESPGPPPGNSSTRLCHPEIHQSPGAGGLDLLCEAVCGPGVAVGWTQAPGGLEAYQRWEAGAQAWLSVPWAGCSLEGWFRCRLDPGGQMASLYLVPEICSQTTPPALWTGSLVLGLLFLVFLTYRLWKRCRPAQ
ncbi:PREDICTED: mucosal addressin cell adhesion molecule 1 [Odobenus rosmarus divergens]|uniref:Mucosal addressin cell adhesion molecule 1 n=1 Tax=Odobenus rosmarus divergens TaxID=9708 RepID=A0A2U3VKQ1_ODORO|nr:PREDICTED: mucosal addressin cell adhesion molecule 1 [Odobenus rosmarus divergens]